MFSIIACNTCLKASCHLWVLLGQKQSGYGIWREILQSLSLVLHTKLQTPSVHCTPGQGRCLYIKGNFIPTRIWPLCCQRHTLRGMLTTALKMRPDFKRDPSGAARHLRCKFCQKSRTASTIITWLLNSDWYTHTHKNLNI